MFGAAATCVVAPGSVAGEAPASMTINDDLPRHESSKR
jgi:hypothetical protein